MDLFTLTTPTPIGVVGLEGSADGLARVFMPSDTFVPSDGRGPVVLRTAAKQLREYFNAERKKFEVPLIEPDGTEFQRDTWRAVQKIRYGHVTSYGAIAIQINAPQAYRAVGSAVGKNPLAIFIPCHRVVGSSGIGGYSGGLAIKHALLELEGVFHLH
jgi:methylated-DNA-[protein]-cysteine S-methyltransferase